jgi:hypothetical protein
MIEIHDEDKNRVYFTRDGEKNRGHGYWDGDVLCLIKCPSCEKENYAPAVSSGLCAMCGYKYEK